MTTTIKLALCQYDFFVGDIEGNCRRILAAAATARAEGADMRRAARNSRCPAIRRRTYCSTLACAVQVDRSLEACAPRLRGIDLLVGLPRIRRPGNLQFRRICRAAGDLRLHRKQCLPNYRVFDEKRYFHAGDAADGGRFQWHAGRAAGLRGRLGGRARAARRAPPARSCCWSSMPRPTRSTSRRSASEVRAHASPTPGMPLVYVNLIGGQDELVFDGNSFVMDARGQVTMRAPAFTEGLYLVDLAVERRRRGRPLPGRSCRCRAEEESVYGALVQGMRDYVDKHRFPGVVHGSVGRRRFGADAVHRGGCAGRRARALGGDALALHLADEPGGCRAAGAHGSTSATARSRSRACSRRRCRRCRHEFAGLPPDTAEENIQSRCRGVLLMGISNKTGRMLLTTGNKSEMAVGYATLYGDMAGGLRADQGLQQAAGLPAGALAQRAVAGHSGSGSSNGAPSAELRHDQKDTDTLPPYEVLDPILEAFIEEDLSVDQIAARGFDRADGRAHPGSGEAQRIQAPSGPARGAGERPGLRPRLALSDHQRLPVALSVRRQRAAALVRRRHQRFLPRRSRAG